jgi:hypothetical protein
MAANTPLFLADKSQQGLLELHKQCVRTLTNTWNLRKRMLDIDLAYLRENDFSTEQSRAKLMNSLGDPTRIQNLTIPIIMPQVVSAVAYQAAVFLTPTPMFELVSSPKYESAALQFQAIIEENSIRGGWVRQFLKFFYDIIKYNHGAIEVDWHKVYTAAIETDVTFDSGRTGKPKQLIWEGNCIKRWDPYNTFFDSRVDAPEVAEYGEFAGTTQRVSRIRLKQFINTLENVQRANIKAAFEAPGPGAWGDECEPYYVPPVNSEALLDITTQGEITDWNAFVGISGANPKIDYKNEYELSTLYARVIPSDFDIRIPSSNTPQVFKMYIVNHSVLIYAERQTNAHDKIPVLFGQAAEDGLSYQAKSLVSNAKPFQEIATALANSVMASRRRAITDRALYDPSRVSEAHMNSPNPSAKIPVRPSAYGKPVSDAVYQFPFSDNQAALSMQEIQAVVGMADTLNSQNQARQGQFVKGNKTNEQWQATMANATSKDQMTALLLEAQVFTPLKEIIKINTLQYQPQTTVYSQSKQSTVQIDPAELRKSILAFKMTDGLVPTEKVISTEVLQVALQVIASSPQIGSAYRIGDLFSYLMKTQNADLTEFQKSEQQLTYEQAMGLWQQQAQFAAEKETPFSTPQPTPEQFGYTPNNQQDETDPDQL